MVVVSGGGSCMGVDGNSSGDSGGGGRDVDDDGDDGGTGGRCNGDSKGGVDSVGGSKVVWFELICVCVCGGAGDGNGGSTDYGVGNDGGVIVEDVMA